MLELQNRNNKSSASATKYRGKSLVLSQFICADQFANHSSNKKVSEEDDDDDEDDKNKDGAAVEDQTG